MEMHIKRLLLPAGLLAGLLLIVILFLFDPSRSSFYPQCLFHRLTNLNCPGCGSLRALHALLHGHVLEALRLNALLVVSLPFAGWIAFRVWQHRRGGAPLGIRPVHGWAYGIAWLVFGIVRELPIPMLAAWTP
jgi:hypothetical protein